MKASELLKEKYEWEKYEHTIFQELADAAAYVPGYAACTAHLQDDSTFLHAMMLDDPTNGLCRQLYRYLTKAKSRGSTSRSADRGDMFIPRSLRLRQGKRAFSVAALHQRNRLPAEIRCISNTEQFKWHTKTFLFKSAFTDHWLLKAILILKTVISYSIRHFNL